MRHATLTRILDRYGLEYTKFHAAQTGYRNRSYRVDLHDGRRLNLILYKSEPRILDRITNANQVSAFLARRDFPVRHLADERIIALRVGSRDKYGALYGYLPGETIPWESYTRHPIKLLGAMLSDMHSALQDFDDSELRATADAVDEYEAILGRMEVYFGDRTVRTAIRRKLGVMPDAGCLSRFRATLHEARSLPGRQALHMDFVRGNVLFDRRPDSGELFISGVLDFEKTAYGSPVLDIARTLAFLLVDCKFKPEAKVRKYFLHSGYRKRGRNPLPAHTFTLGGERTDALEALVDLFLFHDLYKFLRHNPYEYLESNEHYVRTRNILVSRGLVLPTADRRAVTIRSGL